MEKLKYRLGNQPEEYELKEDYLDWNPVGKDWVWLCMQRIENEEVTITNTSDGSKKILFLHHFIIKDAFPLSFFGETRAINWTHFAIVSYNETSEKFIIPLY